MKLKQILKWTAATILLALILSVSAGFIVYWTSTNECDRKTAAPIHPMKAIVQCEYGPPDLLKFEDVEKPVPNDNQVLIKVRAASLNFIDAGLMRAPFPLRLFAGIGLRKPKTTRLGSDVAGVVETVGKNVTQFKPDDEVFGLARHSLAEYTCARERTLVVKPPNVTFEQAACGIAALTALQGLRTGKIQPGQKVLINGASGGVGTFAIQIAKAFGAEVTAVCSTSKADLARSIGADHVIDYTKEDFTRSGQRYDMLYDNVSNHSRAERSRILTPNGICVLAGIGGAGPHEGQWSRIGGNFTAFLASRFSRQKFQMYGTTAKQEDLTVLGDLMATGKVTPVIDRTYKLSETAEAMRYLEQGHARGKIVIKLE
ncbi:MAG TPA: NAD(P)-dependent alcohol dehydrogenase [Chthoniobacterales bacterium]|jgi:NADPH:quinone reductase-like Zn-dependent oxidoreductase